MKVGFFDSGIGGLSILSAFQRCCPGIETEYIADSKHCPYGNRSDDEIYELSRSCVERLLAKGCGMIVIACNTATAAAIDRLRREYQHVPFVGIEPAIKPAAIRSKTGVVAVLATRGTFNGRLYNETKARFAKNVNVIATVADEFVREVEKLRTVDKCGRIGVRSLDQLSPAEYARLELIVRNRIEPLLAAGADYLVLGCTHFPHLKSLIEKVAAGRAAVLDPSVAVAHQVRRIIMKLTAFILVLLFCQVGWGKVESLFGNWKFQQAGETNWVSVNVPHDWAIGGPFNETNDLQIAKIKQDGERVEKRHTGRTGALPWPGKGTYRRALNIPAGTEYAELVFEGAMAEPEVFADGVKVGEWKNGYNSFIVPIPPTTRELVVTLDNPPASSRWYPGSGLIRPVRLVTGGKTGIATWGTYFRTLKLARAAATVAIDTRLRGESAGARVEWTLRGSDGKVCGASSADVANGTASAQIEVSNPHLWSPETPTLYVLRTALKLNGEILDERTERVGIRTAGFTREGFFLNGEKRPFRGVCLHHDLGPIGAAFNPSAFRRQLRLLKEMGADSIRTSHNMPSPDQMAICDEMGMMVMAESFDMWMTPETPNDYSRHFREWWRRDLENLLNCHRSHPSIVMWSIGNEIHEEDAEAVRNMAKAMTELCHRMDPTRPVVFVTDRPDAYAVSGAIQATDVPALTYRLPRYEFMHEHSPIGLVLGGETASTFSSRGCYHFPDEVVVNAVHPDGQSSSYDLEHGSWSNLPDDDWAMQDDHPWAIGEFVWTGFDYLGEPTPYKTYWPSRSSYFGMFDLAGLPKDRAWFYRTRWQQNSPTLHMLPHWTWPGREGKVTPVYVYTSYREAELFVNGVSQGRRRRVRSSRLDRYRLRWREVVYQPGELKVVAYDERGKAREEKVVRTAGTPAALRIRPEQTALTATPERHGNRLAMPELGYFDVAVVDRDGNLCPNADCRIEISVSGPAVFKGVCNGDATSLESFVNPSMKAFHGQLVFVVEPTSEVGTCTATVTAEGLKPATIELPTTRSRESSL